MLELNSNNLQRISNESEQIIYSMDMNYLDYVMTFTTAITSISNTIKKFLLQSDFHSSYIQTMYNDKQ